MLPDSPTTCLSHSPPADIAAERRTGRRDRRAVKRGDRRQRRVVAVTGGAGYIGSVLVRRLPDFDRQPRAGSFRRWLRTITVNCLRDYWGREKGRPKATGDSDARELLAQLADPDSGLSKEWDQEHDQHVTRKLLEMIRPAQDARIDLLMSGMMVRHRLRTAIFTILVD